MRTYSVGDGQRSFWPEYKDAVALKLKGYWSPSTCDTCGSHSKTVNGDFCLSCMNHACGGLGNAALRGDFDSVFTYDPTSQRLCLAGGVWLSPQVTLLVFQRWEEYAAAPQLYVRSGEVPKKGFFGLRLKIAPRQVALHNGEQWYKPEEPCPHCHTFALRNVHNGRCQGCDNSGTKAENPTRALIDSLPADYVITRPDAQSMGFPVYRTGKACRHGHPGWRWVSTRGCCDCTGMVTVK